MRKATWLVAVVLVLVLSATSALAMTVIYDRFDRGRGQGVCLVQTDVGIYWMVRYMDSRTGTPYQFDMTDIVLSRQQIRMRT